MKACYLWVEPHLELAQMANGDKGGVADEQVVGDVLRGHRHEQRHDDVGGDHQEAAEVDGRAHLRQNVYNIFVSEPKHRHEQQRHDVVAGYHQEAAEADGRAHLLQKDVKFRSKTTAYSGAAQ